MFKKLKKGPNMLMTAWGEEKEVIEFLDDPRVHPSITRDVVVKRIKRGEIPEIALTKGVCDEQRLGDTKVRRKAREEKMIHRTKMFLLAQEVRKKYNMGVDRVDIQQRYNISKSQLEKFISGNEYYNIHWAGTSIPKEFVDTVKKIRENGSKEVVSDNSKNTNS